MVDGEVKFCVSCGRKIQWRKKWARSWDEVRYCSDACRRRGVTAVDRELEALLRAALGRARGPVPLDEVAASWNGAHPRPVEPESLRRAARRLVVAGLAEIVQNGRVVDPSTARGPISVRRRG